MSELCILFDCHAVVCALPTRLVDRLILPEEAALFPVTDSSARELDGKRVLESAGARYAAWDLGEMVELPSLSASWLLLRLPHRKSTVLVALRAGRCRAVQRVDRVVALPSGIFRRREQAFPASFALETTDAARLSLVGLCLDPLALWSKSELEASERSLELHDASKKTLELDEGEDMKSP